MSGLGKFVRGTGITDREEQSDGSERGDHAQANFRTLIDKESSWGYEVRLTLIALLRTSTTFWAVPFADGASSQLSGPASAQAVAKPV